MWRRWIEIATSGKSIPYIWQENPGKVKPFHPCAGSISEGSAPRAGRRPSSDPTVRTPLFKADCSLVWHYVAGRIPTFGRRSIKAGLLSVQKFSKQNQQDKSDNTADDQDRQQLQPAFLIFAHLIPPVLLFTWTRHESPMPQMPIKGLHGLFQVQQTV